MRPRGLSAGHRQKERHCLFRSIEQEEYPSCNDILALHRANFFVWIIFVEAHSALAVLPWLGAAYTPSDHRLSFDKHLVPGTPSNFPKDTTGITNDPSAGSLLRVHECNMARNSGGERQADRWIWKTRETSVFVRVVQRLVALQQSTRTFPYLHLAQNQLPNAPRTTTQHSPQLLSFGFLRSFRFGTIFTSPQPSSYCTTWFCYLLQSSISMYTHTKHLIVPSLPPPSRPANS